MAAPDHRGAAAAASFGDFAEWWAQRAAALSATAEALAGEVGSQKLQLASLSDAELLSRRQKLALEEQAGAEAEATRAVEIRLQEVEPELAAARRTTKQLAAERRVLLRDIRAAQERLGRQAEAELAAEADEACRREERLARLRRDRALMRQQREEEASQAQLAARERAEREERARLREEARSALRGRELEGQDIERRCAALAAEVDRLRSGLQPAERAAAAALQEAREAGEEAAKIAAGAAPWAEEQAALRGRLGSLAAGADELRGQLRAAEARLHERRLVRCAPAAGASRPLVTLGTPGPLG